MFLRLRLQRITRSIPIGYPESTVLLPGVNGALPEHRALSSQKLCQSTERDFRFIPDNTAKRPQINKRAQITTTRTWYIPLIELANGNWPDFFPHAVFCVIEIARPFAIPFPSAQDCVLKDGAHLGSGSACCTDQLETYSGVRLYSRTSFD